jgi:DNA polymerase-3 subunit epsilon
MHDGVGTARERSDLQEVSALLGYDDADVASLLNHTTTIAQPPTPTASMVGLSICFTGESMCTLNGARIERAQAEQLAARAGMVVKSSVTKALDILILADPDSMSGKAIKARRYGIRLMAEAVFWRELGVPID